MPVTESRPGPYAPSSAVLEFVSRARQRGVPSPVNADVLARGGVSDSLIPRTLQTLQTLDLIDSDGKPTQTLEGLQRAPEAEYQDRLTAWLRSAYSEIFKYADPVSDEPVRIRDAFRGYNPQGMQDRMVSLFLGLCTAAGIVPNKAKPKSGATAAQPRPAARPAMRPPMRAARTNPPSTPQFASSSSVPAPLAGLLASLPADGEGWTSDKRNKFLAAFETVLDLCFPVVPHGATEDDA